MSTKGLWEDVTVVLASEFGRTLMGNSGNGRYVYFGYAKELFFDECPYLTQYICLVLK